jgi:hypothetical protein
MMKDQFMAKAGFADVRGHDAYTKAYARSGWGVDDRAFFEQSATFIEELDASGAPWFATLLTVGTHHPYTVPEDFRTGDSLDGDPHARAVRYLDQAVSAFVAKLEASHVLDDTLVLVTSDESFGVEGYDDVTHLLSYNWGFLIAKAPGEGPKVIGAPYAQTDVALSIADYLGIGSAQFVGRSIFREYEEPRNIVFANTYQQKIYWASPPEMVECDEALTACQRHTTVGAGLFGASRTTRRAEDVDVAPLREMVALTNTHEAHAAAGRTPLILENAVVWEPGPQRGGLVFGGQYFTLAADQEVVISLDATPVGADAGLTLDFDLFARGMLYEVYAPALYSGDTLRLQYVYAPGKVENNMEVRLFARDIGAKSGRLVLRNAEMQVRPRTLAEVGGVTTQFAIERARPMQTYALGSGIESDRSDRHLLTAPCVVRRMKRELVARGCGNSILVYGPYAKVAAGSEVRATFEVVSELGSAKLSADLVSGGGKATHARSDVVAVQAGSATTLTFTARAHETLDGVEARLGVAAGDANAALIIRRAVVEVFPPSR